MDENKITEINEIGLNEVGSLLTPKYKIKKLKKILTRLIKVLNILKIKWWADGGTLLGLIKYESIIPWDDDIDLGILLIDEDKIYNNFHVFEQNNLRVRKNRTNTYWQIDNISKDDILNEIHIDIFLYKYNAPLNTILYNTDSRFILPDIESGHCNIQYKHSDLFPLIQKPFYNFTIYCPNNYNNVLSNSLGDDYLEKIIIKKNTPSAYKIYKVINQN